jgi:hypothetical protein
VKEDVLVLVVPSEDAVTTSTVYVAPGRGRDVALHVPPSSSLPWSSAPAESATVTCSMVPPDAVTTTGSLGSTPVDRSAGLTDTSTGSGVAVDGRSEEVLAVEGAPATFSVDGLLGPPLQPARRPAATTAARLAERTRGPEVLRPNEVLLCARARVPAHLSCPRRRSGVDRASDSPDARAPEEVAPRGRGLKVWWLAPAVMAGQR